MKTQERKRVLVIDDNKNLLKGLSDFLDFKGFHVATAESGEAGLVQLQAFIPNIILLDIAMPGMGGVGFLKRITSTDGKLQYPVIVFTARSTTKEFFESIAVDGFIAKPYDKNKLVDQIRSILSRQPPPVTDDPDATQRIALIGEDERLVSDRLAEEFHNAGYEVVVVTSGPEVVEQATVIRPTVILLKNIMPRMNGNTVKTILETMPRTKSIPILLYEGISITKKEDDEKHVLPAFVIKSSLMSDNAAELIRAANNMCRAP